MKSPAKMQQKLLSLLRNTPVHLQLPDRQWNEIELSEAASIVRDYVNWRPDVIESEDPLREWLDEYRFFINDRKQ